MLAHALQRRVSASLFENRTLLMLVGERWGTRKQQDFPRLRWFKLDRSRGNRQNHPKINHVDFVAGRRRAAFSFAYYWSVSSLVSSSNSAFLLALDFDRLRFNATVCASFSRTLCSRLPQPKVSPSNAECWNRPSMLSYQSFLG